MTYESYRYIFWGGMVLAGIMLIISILLFFLLKIPTVVGDLTGANARRAIASIRSQNESAGERTEMTERFNIQQSTYKQDNETTVLEMEEETDILGQSQNIFEIEQEITFIHTKEVVNEWL